MASATMLAMSPFVSPQLFLVSLLAGWLNQEQQKILEFLQEENRVLKEQLGARLHFSDDQRPRLAAKGKELGRKLLEEVATLVTPHTILRWHRQLIARPSALTGNVVAIFASFASQPIVDAPTRFLHLTRIVDGGSDNPDNPSVENRLVLLGRVCYPPGTQIGPHSPILMGKIRAGRRQTRMNFPILNQRRPA